MSAPFAAFESATADAAMAALANCTATVGGVACRGIFDSDYGDPLGLTAGNRVVFTTIEAPVSSAEVGDTVVIGAATYAIGERQSDGTGLVRLVLEKTS